jgi:hypothetical protein
LRTRAALQLKILALRHQIGVLKRSVKRPKLTAADRCPWAWLCSVWNGWEARVSIIKAATVIGWQRKGFGLFWSWKIRRAKPGRPPVPQDVRELIRMLSRDGRAMVEERSANFILLHTIVFFTYVEHIQG